MLFTLATCQKMLSIEWDLADLIPMTRQKLQEADHFSFRDIILDASCAEVAYHCLKIIFVDEQGVELVKLDEIFVEPLVARVE